jgi:hypothetical protein
MAVGVGLGRLVGVGITVGVVVGETMVVGLGVLVWVGVEVNSAVKVAVGVWLSVLTRVGVKVGSIVEVGVAVGDERSTTTKLSNLCWLALLGIYVHKPTSPLANAVLFILILGISFTSTLILDPLVFSLSLTHCPAWYPLI